jgi:hypothetical protein
MKNILFSIFLGLIFIPLFSFAHQPQIVNQTPVEVIKPEISKAYYNKLNGEPDIYFINSSSSFNLYVNLLVPDIENQKKDVSAVILKDNKQLEILEGSNYDWKLFSEPFGYDKYWMGPEYEKIVEPGTYEIRAWSSNNDSKYSLAIGKIEAFGIKESIEAYRIIPILKKDFFEKSPIDFIFSPLGYGLIVTIYIIAFLIGFIFHYILKKSLKENFNKTDKNIGITDRIIRLIISIVFLLLAILTTWNFILILISGIALFESIFGWCGFYAVIGKNTYFKTKIKTP